ncbi:hypothetical protein ZOD2009_15741 [Haladaptatus paucihalophilus DX253]|uniref:Uncharacterized protein n=1 Tax=Haladaptatus paucihalophilus DX253 TaxID=797209 RepID=E7QWG0_HALPU|nr:hypothetical protein ZOD2009_15741 [Haladaptatus paucihalophilus DX253]SHL38548.1 hypothetical protein SAMN05444342_3734 [Haladaptatus paucihalophilus DX253]
MTASLFSPVISESEFSFDFVNMALIVQSFDDIFGSRPLEIFFLS